MWEEEEMRGGERCGKRAGEEEEMRDVGRGQGRKRK